MKFRLYKPGAVRKTLNFKRDTEMLKSNIWASKGSVTYLLTLFWMISNSASSRSRLNKVQ